MCSESYMVASKLDDIDGKHKHSTMMEQWFMNNMNWPPSNRRSCLTKNELDWDVGMDRMGNIKLRQWKTSWVAVFCQNTLDCWPCGGWDRSCLPLTVLTFPLLSAPGCHYLPCMEKNSILMLAMKCLLKNVLCEVLVFTASK